MDPNAVRKLLESLQDGQTSVDEAVRRLASLPFEDLDEAVVDHHRALRCGFPEVIYGAGKTSEQIQRIFARLAEAGGPVLVTRTEPEAAEALVATYPDAQYDTLSRTVALNPLPQDETNGYIAVVAAGTSDLSVAEEARITAETMGTPVKTIYDVGVAGLHRLLGRLEPIQNANALVVVAGMEGALPSVVGGLVSKPVIAVPTSVGYGANMGGVTALLGMLTSCASGVSVVNIDNGFGGGYQASLIHRLVHTAREPNA